jgi:hypothetical protein
VTLQVGVTYQSYCKRHEGLLCSRVTGQGEKATYRAASLGVPAVLLPVVVDHRDSYVACRSDVPEHRRNNVRTMLLLLQHNLLALGPR